MSNFRTIAILKDGQEWIVVDRSAAWDIVAEYQDRHDGHRYEVAPEKKG